MAVALLCISGVIAATCGGADPDPTRTSSPTVAETATPTSVPTNPAATTTPAPVSNEPPDRDLFDLAVRFRGVDPNTSRIARSQPFDYAVGDAEQFYVLDLAGEPDILTITATLRKVSDHAYFFLQNGIPIGDATFDRVASDFDSLIYPTVQAAFGSEWIPGIDTDERITLLHANLSGAGGYFSAGDQLPRAVVPFSNEREMVYIEAGVLGSPGTPYNALVAHEYQHLIHSHVDASEDSWVNEGLSQIAAEAVGGGSDWLGSFLATPDTGLIDWPEIGSSAIHYAASELFFSYLLDRFGGPENAHVLVAEQRDSVGGVRDYLEEFDAEFEDVFADWVITNYLDDPDGKYSHTNVATSINPTTTADYGDSADGDVSQYAADYIAVNLGGGGTFTFDGADEVAIGVPQTDGAFYWSQRGDDIDSRMTREFDLTDVARATLQFDAWFDIERGWDYAYVAASTDGGSTWQALEGSHTTDYDPVGQSYGPAYTGDSGGWVEETIDLSGYAGDTVLIRFEYITDESTHHTGFAIDNVTVPEIGFEDGGEDASGWESEGFSRVDGPLEQRWIVQAIDLDSGRVARLELAADNAGTALLGPRSIVVIAAATEGTSERASYSWSTGAE